LAIIAILDFYVEGGKVVVGVCEVLQLGGWLHDPPAVLAQQGCQCRRVDASQSYTVHT
jgi:hypothetical protein